MIAIIKFFTERKVSVQNFGVLSQYFGGQSLIDPCDLHFASLEHKKDTNLPLRCFFQKSAGCLVLSIY